MTLLTLHRQAPVAPGAAQCRLCDAPIAGTLQDHLLAGQPGTNHVEAAICQRCGEALRRLVELFGPEVTFVIQEHRQRVERLIGGPAARNAIARTQADRPAPAPSPSPAPAPSAAAPGPARAELKRTREHLTHEADTLAGTERALRAEVDRLADLEDAERA